MRLRVKLTLALCAVSLLATSCSMFGGTSSPVIDRIRKTNTIRIGIAGDYPPLNAKTTSGAIIGLDADLARALGLMLDVKVEIVQTPFKELLSGVRSHELDAAISGITMTPRRNMDVMFAGPYFVSTKAVLGKAETMQEIRSIADLETKVKSVAAPKGGTSETLATLVLKTPKIVLVNNADEGVRMVRNGTVDAMIADSPIASFAMLRFPGDNLAMLELEDSEDPVGIALSIDDPVFLNLVQNYLANLEEIEILQRLREHWLEGDSSWIKYLE